MEGDKWAVGGGKTPPLPFPYNFSLGASYKPTIYLHYAPKIAICRFAGKK